MTTFDLYLQRTSIEAINNVHDCINEGGKYPPSPLLEYYGYSMATDVLIPAVDGSHEVGILPNHSLQRSANSAASSL